MPDPQQDLAVIRRLMEESQTAVAEDGRHFLLWGALSAVGLLGTWAAVVGVVALDPRWLWAAVVAVGWTGSFWMGIRGGRRSRVRTLGGRLIAVVWISCGVTLTLIAAAGLLGGVVPVQALSGLVAVVLAGGFLGSAVLTGQRWLGAVAAAWWLGGGVMLFFPGLYTLPLLAAMAIALEVVPGLVLRRQARRRPVAQAA